MQEWLFWLIAAIAGFPGYLYRQGKKAVNKVISFIKGEQDA